MVSVLLNKVDNTSSDAAADAHEERQCAAAPAGEGLTVKRYVKRALRPSSDYAVTTFVTTSMLPRTAFEYGQI
ncbi:hypothetical protein PTKU64_82550 [Paraburkholderia terrae]|uniref:Uncharacterized protein n=1 Tax=Paraburkholderia terrae TaxID=311230 RepID=A0ABN6JUT6_9BURK|nr:hypothetical protein PTKU64_82550 [Paraburkholderia terrae]